MSSIYTHLLDKLESGLHHIENSTTSTYEKCSTKIELCQQLVRDLRATYISNTPEEVEEQIQFFKEIKPTFTAELKYQTLRFEYFRKTPKGSLKSKKQYINKCLDITSRSAAKYNDFNTYIQSGSTQLDKFFFAHRNFDPKVHAGLKHPHDIDFSSPGDHTLSFLQANDRFAEFLIREQLALKNPRLDPSWESQISLQWNRSKTELVELIYALHSSKSVNGSLSNIVEAMEQTFNIDIGNTYRIFTDIKLKKNPTTLLDHMKISIQEKIRAELR